MRGYEFTVVILLSLIWLLATVNIFAQASKSPSVSVSGPSILQAGDEPQTFTAQVNDIPGDAIYQWEVSEGTITSGQGTPVIMVLFEPKTSEWSVTVTVTVKWNGGKDSLTAMQTSSIPPVVPGCRGCGDFDKFGELNNEEMLGRFDQLMLNLHLEPSSTGFVVYTRSAKEPGKAARRARWAIEYLIRTQKFDSNRIQTADNGIETESQYRLMLIPAGAVLPETSGTDLAKSLPKSITYDSYSVLDYLYGLEYPQRNRRTRDLAILRDLKKSENRAVFLGEVADLMKKNSHFKMTILVNPERGLTLNPFLFAQVEKDYLVNEHKILAARISLKIGVKADLTQLSLILERGK